MGLKKIRYIAEYLILTLISLIFIIPVVFLVLQSFATLFSRFSLGNYAQVFSKARNANAFRIGLIISASASLVTVATTLTAAIALKNRPGKFSDAILATILMLSGLPYCALVIPLYFILFQARLLDSLPVITLFLAAANIPANVWLLCQFLDTIPDEIEETSRMDGADPASYFARILLPQLVPVLTGICLTTFINSWGNFIVPFILVSSSVKLPTALAFFQTFSAGDPGLYGYLSAYAVLYYIPVIILYFMLRLGMTKLFVVHRIRA